MPGSQEGKGTHLEAGMRHKLKPQGGLDTEDVGGGWGGRAYDRIGPPPPPPGSLAPDEGVVLGCGRPLATACSSYPRADHGRGGRPIPLHATPGGTIPISIESFPVEDLVPTEDNIEWAVKQLRNHHSGGPSGMRAEHIKEWLEEAQK